MVKYFDDDDDDDIVADGESVRCPLYLCDSVQAAMIAKYGVFDGNDYRPHHPARMPDEIAALRQQTRSDYLRQLSDAWKPAPRGGLGTVPKPDSGGSSTSDARTAARDARLEMIKRAENAWRRTPSRDAAEPDNSSPPELMRRHLEPDEPDDDVQARRDAIWNDYKTRLGNAWKTDPRAASAIEQQGERWRGGR